MNLKKIAHEIKINKHTITKDSGVYFIADIGSNHEGDLERAKELIYLAKESGAQAVKFQHFLASKIVSDYGFRNLGGQKSHQAHWDKSIYETYKQYETDRRWTEDIYNTCQKAGVDFMTTPYDFEAVDCFASLIPAFKIGSGDITWIELIKKIASQQKPVLLATGASTMEEVRAAVEAVCEINPEIVVMQCNTNYTTNLDNFKYINLNVIKSYAREWPGMILGLSDHTLGHTTVLGAVAFGARIIEKHFTDDNARSGPDHAFAMNPRTWRLMVDATAELLMALGDGVKKVEDNERETVVLQRRCIRMKHSKNIDEIIKYEDLEFLRPAPQKSLSPSAFNTIVNKKLKRTIQMGDAISLEDVV